VCVHVRVCAFVCLCAHSHRYFERAQLVLTESVLCECECARAYECACVCVCVYVFCNVSQCVVMCCSVLQCIAVCCSVVWQCALWAMRVANTQFEK